MNKYKLATLIGMAIEAIKAGSIPATRDLSNIDNPLQNLQNPTGQESNEILKPPAQNSFLFGQPIHGIGADNKDLSVDKLSALNSSMALFANVSPENIVSSGVIEVGTASGLKQAGSQHVTAGGMQFKIDTKDKSTYKVAKHQPNKNKLRGLESAQADVYQTEQMQAEVITGTYIDPKTGNSNGTITQTIDASGNTHTVAYVWGEDSYTQINTRNINGRFYESSITISNAGLEELSHKYAEHHDGKDLKVDEQFHAAQQEFEESVAKQKTQTKDQDSKEFKEDLGRRLASGIPMKNGKKLLRFCMAFTEMAAQDVGGEAALMAYGTSRAKLLESILRSQGIDDVILEVSSIKIGPSLPNVYHAMSWAKRIARDDYASDFTISYISGRENELAGIAGVAQTGCGTPTVYGTNVLDKNCYGVGVDISTTSFFADLHEWAHNLGAGHQKEYNLLKPGEGSAPYNAAFGYVNPINRKSTIMAYLGYVQPKFSTGYGELGDQYANNVAMIKYSLKDISNWREYFDDPNGEQTESPTMQTTPAPSAKVTAAPSTKTPAPSTRTPAPSTRTPAPSTRTPAPSTRTPAPSTRTPAPSTRTAAPSTRTPVPSTRTPAPSAKETATPSTRTTAPSTSAKPTSAPSKRNRSTQRPTIPPTSAVTGKPTLAPTIINATGNATNTERADNSDAIIGGVTAAGLLGIIAAAIKKHQMDAKKSAASNMQMVTSTSADIENQWSANLGLVVPVDLDKIITNKVLMKLISSSADNMYNTIVAAHKEKHGVSFNVFIASTMGHILAIAPDQEIEALMRRIKIEMPTSHELIKNLFAAIVPEKRKSVIRR